MEEKELLKILQEDTDAFEQQSRLRDDVMDALIRVYKKGKTDDQSSLLNAFLDWRLNKPHSSYHTKEHDIKEFLGLFNGNM